MLPHEILAVQQAEVDRLTEEVARLRGRAERAEAECDGYRWQIKRLRTVLWRIEPMLADPKLRLAVRVVLGWEVDWKHELDDWSRTNP